ncbi:hypothetical protein [Rhodococcus sp. ACS1]|uniref:hypothetical protein n=1 Tax=Rhodococcus sp. ACS1 TaxID=2028570 RepID=UPI0011798C79|nr:hypothetical protein [Rhodococcus sp. ACS1]
MKTYDVSLTLPDADGWIYVEVPELGALTQAKSRGEAYTAAFELISVQTGEDVRDFNIRFTSEA